MTQAEQDYDLNRAAELKYGKLSELCNLLKKAELWRDEVHQTPLVREEVTGTDIAKIIAKWTGISLKELA